ncbi:shikimate kinase AroL [Thalassoglobus sp. JC818]|uniref:shikimate kinase AroL n=1 Tax=Thalassoglobus sp. JC818 TaxID=3232136 RepID=UPI00345A458D
MLRINGNTNMVVTLIGYRATGKSTVGRLLASRLGWEFVDTDEQIVNVAGKSIAEIFRDDGEQDFRELERRQLQQELSRERVVISSGGGAILSPQTRRLMQESGPVVWLTAKVETIVQRLNEDSASTGSRPSLTGRGLVEEVESVLQTRFPLYSEAASFQIETDAQTAEQIVDEIMSHLGVENGGAA